MDKRIVLSVVGAAAVMGVVWLTTRPSESGVVAEQAPTAGVPVTKTTDPVAGAATSFGSATGAAANPPTVSAEAPRVMQPGETVMTPATDEALPIDVSPGFEHLSTPAAEMEDTDPRWSTWRRHQKLQSEPRDEAWAPRMEAALRSGIQDSLTARGFDTQRIELPVVECRTTGCEIQAVGYSGDQKKGIDLQFILRSLLRGSLASEFDLEGYSIMLSSRPDRRVTILAQLPRKKP
jgi:hypothetical protein